MRAEQSFVFEIVFCSVRSLKSLILLQYHFLSTTSNHHQIHTTIFAVSATYSWFAIQNYRFYAWCRNVKRLKTLLLFFKSITVFDQHIRANNPSITINVHYLLLKRYYIHLISRQHCKFVCFFSKPTIRDQPICHAHYFIVQQHHNRAHQTWTLLIGWKGKKAGPRKCVKHFTHISTCCRFIGNSRRLTVLFLFSYRN